MLRCPQHVPTICHIVAVSLFAQSVAVADVVFVDNVNGSDAFRGRTGTPTSGRGGPVRTIARALQIAGRADIISLINRGQPYYESIRLSGGRHSGRPNTPLTIRGNGVTLSGARPIPSFAWRNRGNGLWEMKPFRKGHYQLLERNRPVPAFHPASTRNRPEIPSGQWAPWRGSILYRSDKTHSPITRGFWFAQDEVGISMYGVRHVQIEDLTVRHFRLDGINAHDQCRDVRLLGVRSAENGRSGIAVGGISDVTAESCVVTGNRKYSVRVSESAIVNVEESILDAEPEIIR